MRTLLCVVLLGCGGIDPPRSSFPDAQAAIDRMRATTACAVGVEGTMKADYLGEQGRIRVEINVLARQPASLRMDVRNPFTMATEGTLTTDGGEFALTDMRNKRFLHGPAQPCNIGRLLGNVQLPAHVIVSALRGEAPVLKGPRAPIVWDRGGFYVVRIAGTEGASEEIRLAPTPEDFGKPFGEQRLRVLDFSVVQKGYTLYRVKLEDHAPIKTADAYVDPEGIDPPLPPSGPACFAEIPRKIQIESPHQGVDLRLRYEEAKWNPPLQPGVFSQRPLPGLASDFVTCE